MKHEKTARLPRKSYADRQGNRDRMLGAIGLDAAISRDVIMQTWFGKKTDMRCELVLQADARADRPLQRRTEARLVGSTLQSMQVIACDER